MSVESRTRFDLNWILAALLTLVAVAPLLYPGFFQTQSGFLPSFNAEHLADAPDWGRAADPLRGEGKLPYLLIWPFYVVSGSGIVAIKWGYGLALVLGALGIYAWTRHWLGEKGGVLAAVVYTYLPWHLSTIYVRGAYAEGWLWALWPVTLWAADRLAEQQSKSILAAVIVGLPVLAATFWTQAGLAALFAVVLVAYHASLTRKGQRWVLGLLATTAFVLAALWFVAQRAPEARLAFADHFLHPFQLLSAAWGDGLSFQLGLAAVGLGIVAVALWLSKRSARGGDTVETASSQRAEGNRPQPLNRPAPSDRLGRALLFWLIALLAAVTLTLKPLAFVWEVTGFDAYLTYPWQILALTGLPLAFLAGSTLRLDERLGELPAWAGLTALVVLASYPYLAPSFTQVDPGPEPVAMIQSPEAEAPQIMTLDYEVAPPTEITPTLTLTLTWQAVAPVTEDYTVFVHVLTPDETKLAQSDTRPCDGECPTNTWQPGEIIVDRYRLDLPLDAPPGPYHLAVGLYVLDTGERATVVGREDRTVFLDVP